MRRRGEVVVTPAGSYVLKPRNVPHAFYNAGSETVRLVGIITPGGIEGYFDEYEQIASKQKAPNAPSQP